MSWLAPLLVGRIPIAALANPPALVELFAETITEELDFRLEAQNMLDVARGARGARAAGLRRAPTPPRLVTPPRARDGTAVGLRVRRRRRHEATPASTRRRDPHGHDRLHGGGDDPRRLPRRPARREPLRPARRTHGAARLRHRRTAHRASAPRVPAPDDRRDDERREGPARCAPRPRRPPTRHRPRRSDPRPPPRPASGRPDDAHRATSW